MRRILTLVSVASMAIALWPMSSLANNQQPVIVKETVRPYHALGVVALCSPLSKPVRHGYALQPGLAVIAHYPTSYGRPPGRLGWLVAVQNLTAQKRQIKVWVTCAY